MRRIPRPDPRVFLRFKAKVSGWGSKREILKILLKIQIIKKFYFKN
jgi:hypothetical protein